MIEAAIASSTMTMVRVVSDNGVVIMAGFALYFCGLVAVVWWKGL